MSIKSLTVGTVVENPTIHDLADALGIGSEDTFTKRWPVFLQNGERGVSLEFGEHGEILRMRIE